MGESFSSEVLTKGNSACVPASIVSDACNPSDVGSEKAQVLSGLLKGNPEFPCFFRAIYVVLFSYPLILPQSFQFYTFGVGIASRRRFR